jgi:hypothetical protein
MRGRTVGQNQEEEERGTAKDVLYATLFCTIIFGFPAFIELFEKWTQRLYRKK